VTGDRRDAVGPPPDHTVVIASPTYCYGAKHTRSRVGDLKGNRTDAHRRADGSPYDAHLPSPAGRGGLNVSLSRSQGGSSSLDRIRVRQHAVGARRRGRCRCDRSVASIDEHSPASHSGLPGVGYTRVAGAARGSPVTGDGGRARRSMHDVVALPVEEGEVGA
jgi:hypothetical protein